MVIEAEHRQEARLQEKMAGQEAKFQGIADELKYLIAGLSCQNVETMERRHHDEQVLLVDNVVRVNPWNSSTKLEFSHFSAEGLEDLTMTFQLLEGQYFTLKGEQHGSGQSLNVLNVKQQEWFSVSQISDVDGLLYSIQEKGEWPQLQGLLQTYADVFKEPTSLPPHRDHDHKIIIKSGSQPINARPYKYVAMQKNVIKEMTRDMLKSRSDIVLENLISDLQ
ncbi:hypothetical protein GH714_021382 [Hevea brasiliensis]|uniref:Uncharacterized protein n=1 Tax=Hevea brasiliensis TaxID=3981 RepID=A0A6A6MU42_HEVBR|nr:hypothetical protein GH714_021382 [Hevea brasiliensis]